jgi:2-oxoisovalerate dehydrogenase E2 component (dihydrolipoyl transacylase)
MTDSLAVVMPRLGESVAEGTIVKWLVRPGARVAQFDALVEVDTDKVSTEVPAPEAGVVRELLAAEGQSVKVGTEIAIIEVDGTAKQADIAHATRAVPPAPTPAAPPSAPPNDSDSQVAISERRYSPAVRDLARVNGIDLSRVHGSGEAGRVTRNDVLAFIADVRHEGRDISAGPLPAGAAPVGSEDERVPHSRVRRMIAERMTLSKATIPHAWQAQEVDMSGVVANRALNLRAFAEREGFSLTFLPYVVAAAAAGLKIYRSLNATFTPDHLILHRSINIGIAIGLEGGVIVPVVRDADGLSITGIARAAAELAGRARERKLTSDDLAGATFTVNNSGTFGTVISYSVIAPGQAGILTMGAIKDRVVAAAGSISIRPLMFLSLSLDHRILDGLEAARFLSACREWLEAVGPETSIY